MRILVHDYAGHPFQVQLSRALAARGHVVLHTYCASLQTTPRGALTPQSGDPDTLTISGISLARPLEKFSFVTRWRQENEYGRLIARGVDRFRPDVVLSANTPLDAQRKLLRRCRRRGVRFVFWVQDLIGVAAQRLLSRKLPGVGHAIGAYYVRLERALLRRSDAVVLITDDFRPLMHSWGLAEDRLHAVENWAPLEEMPVRPRENTWAERHGLAGVRCLLYTGTLGMKHNPDLLLRLAVHFRDRVDVRVVVVSHGLGADWLRERRAEKGLDNLLLFGFQPYDEMPDVLGTGDVLLAVLEPDAGVFSVPSKVLTYLCAQRPLLMAVPAENLAARIVERAGAGITVSPTDADAFVDAAERLLANASQRDDLGRNARAHAERTFDIERIADAFEAILAVEPPV